MIKFNLHRQTAIAQGLDHYFTNKPCKRGHISPRRTRGKQCIECEKELDRLNGIREQRSQPNIKAKLQVYYKERAKLPEVRAKHIINSRKHRYGITAAEYKAMLHGQWSACAICRKQVTLGVDHCHKTKKVRGLLCKKCNFGIGYFDDNPAYLIEAAKYLSED